MENNDASVKINETTTSEAILIQISGVFSIDNIHTVSGMMHERIDEAKNIDIVLNTDEIDLCTIQLIISFMKTRNKKNLKTHIDINAPEDAINLLDKTGIIETLNQLQ